MNCRICHQPTSPLFTILQPTPLYWCPYCGLIQTPGDEPTDTTRRDSPEAAAEYAQVCGGLPASICELEHQPDPLAFLRSLPWDEGWVIVPDARRILDGEVSEITPLHLSYFTHDTLMLACDFAGWYFTETCWLRADYLMGIHVERRTPPDVGPMHHSLSNLMHLELPERYVVWGNSHQIRMLERVAGIKPAAIYDSDPSRGQRPEGLSDPVLICAGGYTSEIAAKVKAMGLPALTINEEGKVEEV